MILRQLMIMGTLVLAPVAAHAEMIQGTAAVMQGLDKVTARISTFEGRVGETVPFGTLAITVDACVKRPPDEPPESAAYLLVIDKPTNRDAQQLFSGWMFASSPALNPLEHPVYDVWVIDCKTAAPPASPAPAAPKR